MNELYEKAKYISGSYKKKKDKKDKEKAEDKDIEMKDKRDKKDYGSDNEDTKYEKEKEKEKENKGDKHKKEHSKHHSESKKYEQDIYTSNHHIQDGGLPYCQDVLRILIKIQTSCAPIHEMKPETFFKSPDLYVEQIKQELKEKYQKNSNKEKDEKSNNPTKNLTESLSKSQKILLLASYFASEVSPKNDKSIFKAKKNKGNKRINRKTMLILDIILKQLLDILLMFIDLLLYINLCLVQSIQIIKMMIY